MPVYIHQPKSSPLFSWDQERIAPLLAAVRYRQGRFLGKMEGMRDRLLSEANLETLLQAILSSSEIDGEMLAPDRVRSGLARRLGLNLPGLGPAYRYVEDLVEILHNATGGYALPLTHERLLDWHVRQFPRDRHLLSTAGKKKVHFHTPGSELFGKEMTRFLSWFNNETTYDPVIKAAIAHWWFIAIHPFDEGNSWIARTITELQLSRADQSAARLYSLSPALAVRKKEYLELLERTHKPSLDITDWLEWFLGCFDDALVRAGETLVPVLQKAHFWERHMSASLNDRQRMILGKLLNGLLEGKLTSSLWARLTKTSQDSAGRDINDLVERGILKRAAAGGRSTSYSLTMDVKI